MICGGEERRKKKIQVKIYMGVLLNFSLKARKNCWVRGHVGFVVKNVILKANWSCSLIMSHKMTLKVIGNFLSQITLSSTIDFIEAEGQWGERKYSTRVIVFIICLYQLLFHCWEKCLTKSVEERKGSFQCTAQLTVHDSKVKMVSGARGSWSHWVTGRKQSDDHCCSASSLLLIQFVTPAHGYAAHSQGGSFHLY